MTDQTLPTQPNNRRRYTLTAIAVIFGVLTLISGGKVLFGADEARQAVGSYVPFVVWFNFLAGFAYIAAGWGIWSRASWARPMSGLIFVATVLVGLAFLVHVITGGAFEMRTLGAMVLRAGVWGGIFAALKR